MIRGDRDLGGSIETQKPCHWVFDMVSIQEPGVGGYASAYGLQTDSPDKIPLEATNIKPVREGDVVQETYNLANPRNPKPVQKVHSHGGQETRSAFGFKWTKTEEVPIKGLRALTFRRKHPIIRD